ncbi:MAG: hypothetical protein ACJA2N_000790 [Salibacteraceae bacterium]|jgi:hypothetical protein
MKNNIILQSLFILGFCTSILAISSCKKDETPCCDKNNPECPNYDPCYNKTIANAEFTIGEVGVIQYGFPSEYKDSIIFTDTVVKSNMVEFAVKQLDYDSLKWFIGSEILTTPTVRRRGFPSQRNVSVKLVVWKTVDSLCFPDSPSSDTLIRTFYSADQSVWRDNRYKGVHQSAPNDSVFVSFAPNEQLKIPAFCNERVDGTHFLGYNYYIITTSYYNRDCNNGHALRLIGFAQGNTFTADYQYSTGPFGGTEGPYVTDHFEGIIDN